MRLRRGKAVLVSTAHDSVCAEIGYGERVPERLSLKKLHEKICSDARHRVWSVPKHTECSSWREFFHAAAAISGGERNCSSTALSFSTTTIGPPHLGQSQVSREEGLARSGSVDGCEVAPSK